MLHALNCTDWWSQGRPFAKPQKLFATSGRDHSLTWLPVRGGPVRTAHEWNTNKAPRNLFRAMSIPETPSNTHLSSCYGGETDPEKGFKVIH